MTGICETTAGDKMIERLAGRNPHDLVRIRKMGYYHMWKTKAEWLKTASPKEILYALHWGYDDKSYGYAWKSRKSREALDLVLREEGME